VDWTNYLLDTPLRRIYQDLSKQVLQKEVLTEFNDAYPCVFVLSTGRVGSMTLAALLKYAGNVFSFHEPKPILYPASKAAYQSMQDINMDTWAKIFVSLRGEQLDNSLKLGKGYVETSPQATFLAPVIAKVVKNVKFIHLVRHPTEVIRSGMRRGWYSGHPADGSRVTPLPDSSFYGQWEKMTKFQKNAWLWAETNSWIMKFLETIPDSKKLTLDSKDLYSGQLPALMSLFDFCSSVIPSSRQRESVLSLKMNHQKNGYFPMPGEWSTEEFRQLWLLTGDVASRLGYELQ